MMTREQLADTEVALTNWWCGTDFGQMAEDEVEFSDDAIRGAELFAQHDVDVLRLLTAFRGYLGSAHGEGAPDIGFEDFIHATSIILADKEFHEHFQLTKEE